MKPGRPWSIPLPLAILLLAACSRAPDCHAEEKFCAALVTDTLGVIDHGLNQDAWAGLENSRAEGTLDRTEFIESVERRDYLKNISYFAQAGFDVVITSGAGLREQTLQAAQLYPDTLFIGIGQAREDRQPNLVLLTFAEDQMGFLAGALAADLTQTRVVAAVCESSGIESMWRYCEGFRAGVNYIDEGISVLVEYRDAGSREKSFLDEAWGIKTAGELIRRGADVIFAAGGATGQGALRTASEAGIHAVGSERDQGAALGIAGSNVVTSIYGRAGYEIQMAMRRLRQGVPAESTPARYGYVPLDGKYPEELTATLNSLLEGLLNGEIGTNVTIKVP